MRRALVWTLGILAGAALVHFAVVTALPWAIMARVLAGLAGEAGANTFVHPPLATHESRAVVRPSPDLAYSSAVFDVSERPLHVTVPLTPPYTSLSGFAANTDNFFAVNDQSAGGETIDLVVVGPGTKRSFGSGTKRSFGSRTKRSFGSRTKRSGLAGRRVVESPSDRGVLLVRRVVPSAAELPAIDAARARTRAELLP
jgi:uncharacterized membrane protein